MPPPKNPREEAEQSRARRNWIFEGGAYPKGERAINPAQKRTAYEYHEWAQHQKSHHIQEFGYLDMLEREEREMGFSSYPEGHPRRFPALHGIPWPPRPPESVGPSEPPPGPHTPLDDIIQQAHQGTSPIRVNRFVEPCAKCGQDVAPGGGRIEREAEGWVTYHHPRCPKREH